MLFCLYYSMASVIINHKIFAFLLLSPSYLFKINLLQLFVCLKEDSFDVQNNSEYFMNQLKSIKRSIMPSINQLSSKVSFNDVRLLLYECCLILFSSSFIVFSSLYFSYIYFSSFLLFFSFLFVLIYGLVTCKKKMFFSSHFFFFSFYLIKRLAACQKC